MARNRHSAWAAVVGLALLAFAPNAAAAPIPQDSGAAPVPGFSGGAVKPRRLNGPQPPRHPFMAPNGRSNLHDDGYQSDSYWIPGPLGRGMSVTSTLKTADCASVTFDSRGRIVTVCVGVQGPRMVLMDPRTLETIDELSLPPRIPSGGGGIFNDFAGGGYFYLDNRDRAVVPTTTRHIFVVAVRGSQLVREADYDLTRAVGFGDKIISALPDWSGRLWFASTRGVIGTVDRRTGALRSRALGEPISNSFAVDSDGGVYIVTQRALYRFDANGAGTPALTWRSVYRNSGISKPGQVHAGSGTTPTVMKGGRIAIADNADPMNVVVLRRGRRVSGPRTICEQPVFSRGASATDQSLIAANTSIVVENNYGHSGPTSVNEGKTTAPGLERVDIRRGNRGCRRVWHSNEIAPSVVPKLSLETGLVYTYTKPARNDRTDAWYFTAISFCTGRTRYKRLAGTGLGYNNNFAPVTLGPDGSAYVGTLGGLVRLADSRRPSGPAADAPKGCKPRPRLKLRLRYRRGRTRSGRRCARPRIRARVTGKDRRRIRRVAFRFAKRRLLRDRKSPFVRTVDRRRHRGRSHKHRVRARVLMKDGRSLRLRRWVRVCPRRR